MIADVHGLIDFADQINLDASFGWVVDGIMLPMGQIEIGSEFTIDSGEQVLIELCGDPGAVVISGFNNICLL